MSDDKWLMHKEGLLLGEHVFHFGKNKITLRLFTFNSKYFTELWINNYLHFFSEVPNNE